MKLDIYAPAHGMRRASIRIKQVSHSMATASLSAWRKAISQACSKPNCYCRLEFRINNHPVSPIANPYKRIVEIYLPRPQDRR